jgi:hypothetical protein
MIKNKGAAALKTTTPLARYVRIVRRVRTACHDRGATIIDRG